MAYEPRGIDPQCKGCIHRSVVGSCECCSYFEHAGTTRVARHGLPLPRPCPEKETKKRGRPKRNKIKE